jgi:hypothetical protein
VSLLAGIYSRSGRVRPDAGAARAISAAISRAGDRVETCSDDRLFLAKVDIGAYSEPAFLADGRHAAALAGEPLLDAGEGPHGSRRADLARLAEAHDAAPAGGRDALLARCEGTFSLCVHTPAGGLLLATDKLGVRPLYYSVTEDAIVFSSALRVLETIQTTPRRIDFRGITERIVLGHPLGTRTPYEDIKILRDGQRLVARDGDLDVAQYFEWSRVPASPRSDDALLDEMHRTFLAAVACRSRGPLAVSLLSGGLDSRCIAAALCSLGREVVAVNFSREGVQDAVYARAFADAAGVRYRSYVKRLTGWTWGGLTATAIEDLAREVPTRPLVFSGDGGSVVVGHVNVNERIIAALRAGDVDAGIGLFLETWHPRNRGIYRPSVSRVVRNAPIDGVREELERLGQLEPGRRFQAFLLTNRQRCNMHEHFENIDVRRADFLLPFFDARLLSLVVSAPVEPFLRHALYHRWLARFPTVVSSVPWQTYPGHASCPIAPAVRARDQWTVSRRERTERQREDYEKSWAIARGRVFPSEHLDRARVLLCLAAHGLGLRDCSHVFPAVIEYHRRSRPPRLGAPGR